MDNMILTQIKYNSDGISLSFCNFTLSLRFLISYFRFNGWIAHSYTQLVKREALLLL